MPRTKPREEGKDENQVIDGIGLWFILKNENYSNLKVEQFENCKFPCIGKYHLKFLLYFDKEKIAQIETQVNLTKLPENAKIHIDKNHLKVSEILF